VYYNFTKQQETVNLFVNFLKVLVFHQFISVSRARRLVHDGVGAHRHLRVDRRGHVELRMVLRQSVAVRSRDVLEQTT
jgi:hypothetical protein